MKFRPCPNPAPTLPQPSPRQTDFQYDRLKRARLDKSNRYKGSIFHGYYRMVNTTFWAPVRDALDSEVVRGGATNLVFAGHSQGAGITMLLAYAAANHLKAAGKGDVAVNAVGFATPLGARLPLLARRTCAGPCASCSVPALQDRARACAAVFRPLLTPLPANAPPTSRRHQVYKRADQARKRSPAPVHKRRRPGLPLPLKPQRRRQLDARVCRGACADPHQGAAERLAGLPAALGADLADSAGRADPAGPVGNHQPRHGCHRGQTLH